jgi:uncharacterized protein DUF1629
MAKYFLWDTRPPRGGCVLSEVENFDDLIDFIRGRTGPIADRFPEDVELLMNPDFPKDLKLYDHLYNLDDLTVVSPRLTAFLEKLSLPAIEFLPVKIIDHKGKVASADYAIVNAYNVYDCIDRDKTKIIWNNIDPELIMTATDLTLDESKLDPAVPIFRVKHLAHFLFVRENIANQILAGDFSGPHMRRLDDFDA